MTPFLLLLSFPSRLLSSSTLFSSSSSSPLYLSDSAIAAPTELAQQVPRSLPDPRLPRHHPPLRVCVPEQVGHDSGHDGGHDDDDDGTSPPPPSTWCSHS